MRLSGVCLSLHLSLMLTLLHQLLLMIIRLLLRRHGRRMQRLGRPQRLAHNALRNRHSMYWMGSHLLRGGTWTSGVQRPHLLLLHVHQLMLLRILHELIRRGER